MRNHRPPYIVMNGASIHVAAPWLLDSLLASGHRVWVDRDRQLFIEPSGDIHEDCATLIVALHEDLVALVTACTTLH